MAKAHASKAAGISRKRSRFNHKVALLSKRFRYANRRTMLGQARLFGDRIELIVWGLLGRRKCVIPLVRILELNYHPLDNDNNLSIYLDTDEVIHLRMEDAHLWREHYERWLSYHVLASAKIMSEQEKASAISG